MIPKQTSTPPKQINQYSNKLVYPTFEPKKNTFYLYLEEVAKPNLNFSERSYQTIFGIKNSTDIQRFHLLPGANKICTFIGFSNQKDVKVALNNPSLKSSLIYQKVFIFSTQRENTSNSKISKIKPKTNQKDKVTDKSNQKPTTSQTNSKSDHFHFSSEKSQDKNRKSKDLVEVVDYYDTSSDESENCDIERKETEIIQNNKDKDDNESSLYDYDDDYEDKNNDK